MRIEAPRNRPLQLLELHGRLRAVVDPFAQRGAFATTFRGRGRSQQKFVDRDVNGSINIGLLWLYDNVVGRFRPVVFVRPKQATVGGSGNANAGPKASTSLPAPNSRFEG